MVVVAPTPAADLVEKPNDRGASRFHIMRACEDSLRRLKTDRIDLYYLHVVDISTPLEEILGTLETLVRQGKILYAGTSKWPAPLIVEAIALSERYGLPRLVTEQPPYHLLDRSIENELVWTCMRHGIGIVSFSPLAGGILSGMYRMGKKAPPDSRYEGAGPDHTRLTPAALDAVEKLLPIAAAKGIPLTEFAHAWLLQRPGITAPIVGPRTVEHLQSAIHACDVKLSDEELSLIDEIVPTGRAVNDYYDAVVYSRMRKAVNNNDLNIY